MPALIEFWNFLDFLSAFAGRHARNDNQPLAPAQWSGVGALFLLGAAVAEVLAWLILNYTAPQQAGAGRIVALAFGFSGVATAALAAWCFVRACKASASSD